MTTTRPSVRRASHAILLALLAALTLPLTTPLARADDANVGGDARTFAMGGAGLALPYGGGQRINPASLAYERTSFGIAVPSFGLLTDGLSQTAIRDAAKDGSAGAAGDLLRDYAPSDRTIGANSDFSVRVSKFELSTSGAVRGHVLPNADLQNWAKSGSGSFATLPLDSKADLIAGGYYVLPALAAGTTVPVSKKSAYNYAVGVRVKEMKGVYTHYIGNFLVVSGIDEDAAHAPEMHGANVLSKNGVGADVGFYMQPRGGQGWGAGVTVNNLVNPGFTFDGTDRDGNTAKYKVLGTTLNAGAGYQHRATVFAADVIDIGGTTESAELRLGGEQRILNFLAVRAGYSSHSGYTYGLGIWGFGIAAGKHLPLEATQSLKF